MEHGINICPLLRIDSLACTIGLRLANDCP
jgi:hypothetical protein